MRHVEDYRGCAIWTDGDRWEVTRPDVPGPLSAGSRGHAYTIAEKLDRGCRCMVAGVRCPRHLRTVILE